MKIFHKIELINEIPKIVIYVYYPDNYEFGLDFDSFKKNVKNVSNKIKEYISKDIKDIKDDTALIVLNGVVIGTLLLTNVDYFNNNLLDNVADSSDTTIEATINENTTESANKYILSSSIDVEEEKTEEIKNETTTNKTTTNSNISTSSNKNKTNVTTSNKNTTNSTTSTTTTKPTTTTTTTTNQSTSNNTTNTTPPTTSSTTIQSSKTVNVKLANGNVINLSLEDYVIGVVGSEMPAEFNSEALKAQAVAARTYALKRTANNQTLSATTADQVYKTNDQLKSVWGSSYDKYYNKIKDAVLSTKGVCMKYNGSYIDALYFSTSNGKTEDAVYVWGNSLPYLKSVDSSYDVNVKGFSSTTTISKSQISSKLGVNLTSVSQIQILSRTSGDRVDKVSICGKEFTGVKIRSLLGLRSTDFEVSESGDNIIFTTKGFGHGVGMSQYGANEMAKRGFTYTQILNHYYTGIQIGSI